MIKNIVFDISNVLAPFRFKEFLAEKGFDAEMIKRIIKASAMTPYWTEFEKGKLSYDEAMKGFIDTDPDIADELRRAYESCVGIMGKYDYTERWIDALKEAGYKLYCITNFTPAGYEQCYDCISFIEKFDGCIFSFREGIVKPDPEIYKTLLNRYNLRAEECIFIDDTEENVLSAEKLGFAGIVFTGYEDASAKLIEILRQSAAGCNINETVVPYSLATAAPMNEMAYTGGRSKRKKPKNPYRSLLLIPIVWAITIIAFNLCVNCDTYVFPDPNALGHPAPFLTLFFFFASPVIVAVDLSVTISLIITTIVRVREAKRRKSTERQSNNSLLS